MEFARACGGAWRGRKVIRACKRPIWDLHLGLSYDRSLRGQSEVSDGNMQTSVMLKTCADLCTFRKADQHAHRGVLLYIDNSSRLVVKAGT